MRRATMPTSLVKSSVLRIPSLARSYLNPGAVCFPSMPDGAGAVMIDGKMQDDATWKQAKVLLDLARLVAAKDPEMAVRYALKS